MALYFLFISETTFSLISTMMVFGPFRFRGGPKPERQKGNPAYLTFNPDHFAVSNMVYPKEKEISICCSTWKSVLV